MHMQINPHLVTLKWSIAPKIPLFIVRLPILNVITPFYGVLITEIKTLAIPLTWSPSGFVFLFLLFQVEHLIIISCPPSSPWIESCSTLGLYQPHLIHTLSIEVSTEVSSISQNQTRAFTSALSMWPKYCICRWAKGHLESLICQWSFYHKANIDYKCWRWSSYVGLYTRMSSETLSHTAEQGS
jgi:hypothetical protein